jgi:PBP1b-binding outer membrane lipoprotein LpoB
MKQVLIFCIALTFFLISCGTEKKAEVQTEEPTMTQDTLAVDSSAVDTSAAEME